MLFIAHVFNICAICTDCVLCVCCTCIRVIWKKIIYFVRLQQQQQYNCIIIYIVKRVCVCVCAVFATRKYACGFVRSQVNIINITYTIYISDCSFRAIEIDAEKSLFNYDLVNFTYQIYQRKHVSFKARSTKNRFLCVSNCLNDYFKGTILYNE